MLFFTATTSSYGQTRAAKATAQHLYIFGGDACTGIARKVLGVCVCVLAVNRMYAFVQTHTHMDMIFRSGRGDGNGFD